MLVLLNVRMTLNADMGKLLLSIFLFPTLLTFWVNISYNLEKLRKHYQNQI